MPLIKVLTLVCCLLLLGPSSRVDAAGLDLYKASDCAEIIIDGVGSIALNIIPSIRQMSECMNFTPTQFENLTAQDLLTLANTFLRSATGHPKCLLVTLDGFRNTITPINQRFHSRQCIPR